MNRPNAFASKASREAEETLRVIAKLPAPEGLEGRVHGALREAPRAVHVLSWPSRPAWMESGLARSAAAAAIVFVVAGGGWGVYSRVKPAEAPNVVVMPRAGGFSSAGAMRTPKTVDGTVLAHPLAKTTIQAGHEEKKPAGPAKKNLKAKKSATNPQ
jgi:hypothetical protein